MWMCQHSLKMDQETSINLIQMYASNQILWDSRHEDYYNKIKREEVWDQIAEIFGAPKQELMAKMRSLSGSYRREKNRERKSKDKKRPYQSKWYAYEAFSFLRDKDPLAPEDSPDKCFVDIAGSEDPEDGTDDDEDSETQSQTETKTHCVQVQAPVTNLLKRKLCNALDAKLTNNLEPKIEKLARNQNGDDPYITFGLHIASELRKYDSITLAHVKHAINNVIFQADIDFFQGKHNVHLSKEKSNIQIHQIKSDIDNDDDDDHVRDFVI